MDKNVSSRKKQGILVALLLILIAAFIGICSQEVHAATITKGTSVPSAYATAVGWTSSTSFKTVSGGSAYRTSQDGGGQIWYRTSAGTVSARYTNVCNYNGSNIDVVVSARFNKGNKGTPVGAIDMANGLLTKKIGWNSGADGRMWEQGFSKNNPSRLVTQTADNTVITLNFYKSGTNTPVSMKGHFVISDIDCYQYVILGSGCQQGIIHTSSTKLTYGRSANKVESIWAYDSSNTTARDTQCTVCFSGSSCSFTWRSGYCELIKTSLTVPEVKYRIYTYAYPSYGGSVFAASGQSLTNISAGSSRMVGVEPNSGYNIDKVYIDGVRQSVAYGINYYTLSNIRYDREVEAYFYPDEYTVRYNSNGGSGSTSTQTFEYGDTISLRYNNFTRDGYEFLGWGTSRNSGVDYYEGERVDNYDLDLWNDGDSITLYAQWKPIGYYVRYNGNGATSGSMADTLIQLNGSGTLSKNAYHKERYKFTEWNSKADGSGTSYKEGQVVSGLSSTPADVVNLYAQWEEVKYTIEYKGNGADGGSTESSTHYYDLAQNLNKNGFTRKQYYFDHWNLAKDNSSTSFSDGQSVINLADTNGAKVTLYAQWRENVAPTITTPVLYKPDDNEIAPFITTRDGKTILVIQKGDKFTPLGYATADDYEDGNITNRLEVVENNVPLNEDGIADESGIYTVTYHVWDYNYKDATATMTVLVNEPPEITTDERWFFWESTVPIDDLTDKLIITDKEDGDIPNDEAKVVGVKYEDSDEFTKPSTIDTSKEQDVTVRVSITDDYKKTTNADFLIHVVKDWQTVDGEVIKTIRFISETFMDTLPDASVWKVDPEYKSTLEESLNRTEPIDKIDLTTFE